MKNHTNKRGKVTEEHREEARRLKAIWDATYEARRERGLHTQDVFGAVFEIGNQSAVGFFLHGKTALSLKAARGFAKGLNCNISDFSERLAKEAALNISVAGGDTSTATELTRRMETADAATRKLIEIALLEDDETAISKLTPSLVNLVRAIKIMIREQG